MQIWKQYHFIVLNNATIYIRLIEQSVYQIDGIVLFLIDDLGIHLRHLHIGMAEQLRGGIEIRTECQHHRCKSVPGNVHNLSKSNGK